MVNSIGKNYEPFFVKKVLFQGARRVIRWIDTNSGIEYKELDIQFDTASHGLCEALGKPAYKLLSKRLVLVPVSPDYKQRIAALKQLHTITVDTHDTYNHRIKWEFEPLALYEVLKGIEEYRSESDLATFTGSPVEAVRNLMKVIERRKLLEKIGGGEQDARNVTRGGDDNLTGFSYDLQY